MFKLPTNTASYFNFISSFTTLYSNIPIIYYTVHKFNSFIFSACMYFGTEYVLIFKVRLTLTYSCTVF